MIEIATYKPEWERFFAELNFAWIQKYFWLEDADIQYLEHPEKEILQKGGAIFFALLNEEVIGTCALLKHSKEVYELSKMAVTEKARGQNAGFLLGRAVIDKAMKWEGKMLYLDSNTILEPAINLYRKLGFKEKEGYVSPYARSNIHMELIL